MWKRIPLKDSSTEEMDCLGCCSPSLRSVLTSIRLPALKKHYWARGFSKPISHLTRWKQERLGFLHFRSERMPTGDRLYESTFWRWFLDACYYLTWMKKDSKPEAFSSSLTIFLVSAPWEHTWIFVDEIPFCFWGELVPLPDSRKETCLPAAQFRGRVRKGEVVGIADS